MRITIGRVECKRWRELEKFNGRRLTRRFKHGGLTNWRRSDVEIMIKIKASLPERMDVQGLE
jgi:hypothetical protein